MKRRGNPKLSKRRNNGLHSCRAEQLEDRRLLTGTPNYPIDEFITFADGVLSENNGEYAKFGTSLAMIAMQYDAQMDAGTPSGDLHFSNEGFVQVQNGWVAIESIVAEGVSTDSYVNSLTSLGSEGISSFGRAVSARVPLSALKDLAQLSSASFSNAVLKPVSDVGLVTSQAVQGLNVDDAFQAYGVDGTGITVGILSDSFDALGGYATDVAAGDLPAGVNVLSDYAFGSDEGRGMAQLIYDIAPNSNLMFYTAFNSAADFANGILALANAGADVIVDDVRYGNEPMFQDGIIAQAVDTVVASGVSYFASQGNYADNSYESAFTDSGQTFGNTTEVMHDFDPGTGVDTMQSISIPINGSLRTAFQWDEAFASAGGTGSTSDYNIYLLDANGTVVASSIDSNVGNDASEFLGYVNTTNSTDFQIVITRLAGADAGLMKYVILSTQPTINEYATNSATSFGHSNSAGAAAVGASYYVDTPEFGQDPPLRESFTSLGGVPILFDLSGNRLGTAENRQAPNFSAIDGVNTTFFGQDSDGDGFPNFFGTSAAAPNAAAVAALMLQRNPDLTPTEVYTILQDTAIDMETPGADLLTGYGLIDAFEAVGATPLPSNPTGPGGGGSGSIDVCGVALPSGTTSVAGAIGGNFFASNHAILDGTSPGQLGYDEVILDFLRGNGTSTEIPKSEYSIAVVGNGNVTWSFSNGTQQATGYERTDFYNINYIDPSIFNELISHDLIIVLSGEDAITDGLSASEMALWATVEDNIADAVNYRGLDIWVGASGGDAAYHDFLPTGILPTTAEAGIDPLDGFEVTAEGQLLGITDTMVDAADATFYFNSGLDGDLSTLEIRNFDESISVAAAGIAFYNDELIPAADVPGGTTQGMVGLAFQDLNMDGFKDATEMGIAGAKYFIDYNGDGLIGLCEPTATSNAAGEFILHAAYSGMFQILPVPSPGAVTTTTTPIYVTIADDGSASLSAPLEFGVIAGSDSGNGGLGGSTPVAQGAYLGASPIADDGVFFGNGIKKGTNTVTITSNVVHSNVVLNAWIDLNKDGDFNDANERIFTNVKLTPGQANYTFTIPTSVFDDSVLPDAARLAANMRFRVGPTLNVGPTADDAFGEIEDYKVFITQPADTGLIAVDDVFTYEEDTDGQVFNVLANDKSFFNRSLTIVPGSVTNISPVETPPLDIYVSPDGTRIIFDAAGVMDLTEDITFEYTVQDSAGVMETATVTLVAPIDPMALTVTTNQLAFNNKTQAADVNNDGSLTNIDYVMILNELRGTGSRALPNFGSGSTNFNKFIDVNADGRFSALDLLRLMDIMADKSPQGESLEQEPVATESVETQLAMPVVEVAALISKAEVTSPAAPVSQTYSKFQVIASDWAIASETGDVETVETEVILDETTTELAFSSLGSDQSDLLWSDSDELEFASTDGEAEDDVFADPEWDSELLSY
ncbi:Subtilase family protein [Bremerella volcania]|uniref:Subtilase family protein n=1 Tax=Bremerella volcania TaxID=2527984 RepID=A0A518C719_9BACT|nr:GEVED domain-containing protein [Bremerella volcania]QDU75011.1 Subtilase family protein [Bremerella volcania]